MTRKLQKYTVLYLAEAKCAKKSEWKNRILKILYYGKRFGVIAFKVYIAVISDLLVSCATRMDVIKIFAMNLLAATVVTPLRSRPAERIKCRTTSSHGFFYRFCVSGSFQALIQYADMVSAQSAKHVSIQFALFPLSSSPAFPFLLYSSVISASVSYFFSSFAFFIPPSFFFFF